MGLRVAQVRPGGKSLVPFAGEERDQHFGIILHGAEHFDDLLGEPHTPGIPLLRAVDGHSGNVVMFLVEKRIVGHTKPSFFLAFCLPGQPARSCLALTRL